MLTHGLAGLLLACCVGVACARAKAPTGPTCEERKAHLLEVLDELPRETLATPIEVGLARGTLRGAFGRGATLTISDEALLWEGQAMQGGTRQEQITALVAELTRAGKPSAGESPTPSGSQLASNRIYVAAAHDLDVRALNLVLRQIPRDFELRLLFTSPPPEPEPEQTRHELPLQVLAEQDPTARRALANRGYADYSDCSAVDRAVDSTRGLSERERWPRLREALQTALPTCSCQQLDADGLRALLSAEQRAGTVTLSSVPIGFLREQRCVASMPLRSVQQVLDDIDEFDAEFAGDWKDGELHFDDVVTNERLLNVLCVALPGETLASLQRESATMYWRLPGRDRCEAWQFEPLARGAPLGTWRRVEPELPPLALHYRQGAEDLRVFGPVTDPKSRATDEGPWSCDQNFHMLDQSTDSIGLEGGGRWYFDSAACERAPANSASFAGCVATLAAANPDVTSPAAQ